MTLRRAIVEAATRLATTSETARLDAELLAAHALGVPRDQMLLGRLDDPVPPCLAALVDRRVAGEPVAYIVGERDFWTISLKVGPGVLIPRPDSETLIEAALAHFGAKGPRTILDLGTGSGALLLAALDQWPFAQGTGIDRSEAALGVARDNARRLGLTDRARIVAGDWTHGLEERFDLILCNPPYIETSAILPRDVLEHEPASALFAGTEGLDDYRRLAPAIGAILAPGGIALFEIGRDQGVAVSTLFRAEGHDVAVLKDLAGHDRCVVVKAIAGPDV